MDKIVKVLLPTEIAKQFDSFVFDPPFPITPKSISGPPVIILIYIRVRFYHQPGCQRRHPVSDCTCRSFAFVVSIVTGRARCCAKCSKPSPSSMVPSQQTLCRYAAPHATLRTNACTCRVRHPNFSMRRSLLPYRSTSLIRTARRRRPLEG